VEVVALLIKLMVDLVDQVVVEEEILDEQSHQEQETLDTPEELIKHHLQMVGVMMEQ
jgi:hypothetical protein